MAYLSPLNGGRINATISGNTAGAGALVSSGTLTLAGGNNITLSQAGNAITISGGAGGAGGSNTFGMSNLGNTVGTSGVVSGSALQFAFAGGNNVTLSQSLNASSGTITISAANQTAQTQSNIQAFYDGVGSISTGTIRVSNANGISFGINGQTLTASHNGLTSQTVQTQSNIQAVYDGANSISTGTIRYSNLNGVSFGINGQTLTASHNGITSQTVQTQNLHNVTLSGNTAGVMAQISSGTLNLAGGNNITLSQAGNAITISGGAGGGGIALANSQTTYTSGTANLVVAGGAMTIASTTGQSYNFSVPGTSSLSATGIVSISTNGGTISIGVPAMFDAGMSNGNTTGTSGLNSNGLALAGGNNIMLSQVTDANGATVTVSGIDVSGLYFDNMFQQISTLAVQFTSVSTGMFGRVLLQPLAPGNELFPYDMTATVMRLGFSNSGSSNQSAAFSSSFYFGLYTRANSTQLSIVNSASTSFALAANVGNSASFMGARWMSIHSSQFSTDVQLSAGSRYFFGLLVRTAGNTYSSISLAGMHLGASVQRSGYMAAAATTGTSFNAWHPFMGVHSLTTHTALPVSVANSDINKASNYANFIPQVIFDAGLGQMN